MKRPSVSQSQWMKHDETINQFKGFNAFHSLKWCWVVPILVAHKLYNSFILICKCTTKYTQIIPTIPRNLCSIAPPIQTPPWISPKPRAARLFGLSGCHQRHCRRCHRRGRRPGDGRHAVSAGDGSCAAQGWGRLRWRNRRCDEGTTEVRGAQEAAEGTQRHRLGHSSARGAAPPQSAPLLLFFCSWSRSGCIGNFVEGIVGYIYIYTIAQYWEHHNLFESTYPGPFALLKSSFFLPQLRVTALVFLTGIQPLIPYTLILVKPFHPKLSSFSWLLPLFEHPI